MKTNEKPITMKDVIAMTGYCRSSIHKFMDEGKIPSYKPTGRLIFYESDVRKFMLTGKRVTTEERQAKAADVMQKAKSIRRKRV